MLTLTFIWVVLATVVIALAALRKMAARHEDDDLHLSEPDGGKAIARQSATARRIDRFDSWGKTFTVIVVVYGLGLLGTFLYQGWQQSLQLSK